MTFIFLRPPQSASFRILFRNLFLLLLSFLRILKQVQDDNSLRLLWSVHSDLLSPRHSEFSSESFFYLASLQWILKRVQDDGWTVGWRTFGPTLRTDAFHIQQILHHLERGRSYHTKLPHISSWEIKTKNSDSSTSQQYF